MQDRVLELLETGPASTGELHDAVGAEGLRVQRTRSSFAVQVMTPLALSGRAKTIGAAPGSSVRAVWALANTPQVLQPVVEILEIAPMVTTGYAVRMINPDTVEVTMNVDLYLEILPTLKGKR